MKAKVIEPDLLLGLVSELGVGVGAPLAILSRLAKEH